jgi:hypothetical protein
MENVLNQALFKHRTSATDGFNSLCTIIHQLHVEGYYYGEVLRAQHPIGTFVLRFDKNLPTHEVHIDAAKFDPIFNKDNSARPVERTFKSVVRDLWCFIRAAIRPSYGSN